MSKNIVIFSDGTGQEGGSSHNTNVYRLFNMVVDRSPEQVGFYDRGLGTGWRKFTGNVFGMGISHNIRECYEFLFEQFQAGDQIYLFGFSRGATTVRSLAHFVHLFGILPRSRPELIDQAWKIYRKRNPAKRNRLAKAMLRHHHTMWARIHFLGVWDTVAALGVPFKRLDVLIDKIPFFEHSFQDLTLTPSVENAYHALAIDDERLLFHPTLWAGPYEDYQQVRQVWFPGMHTDVGGGYEECALSDITLDWMVEKARSHGLRIYGRHKVTTAPDFDGRMHDSRGGMLSRFYRRKARSWDASRSDRPVVHQSALRRKLNTKNEQDPPYSPWILNTDHEVER